MLLGSRPAEERPERAGIVAVDLGHGLDACLRAAATTRSRTGPPAVPATGEPSCGVAMKITRRIIGMGSK